MRFRMSLAVTALVVLAACSDRDVLSPPTDGIQSGPSFAISDAGHGGEVAGFWFLPPLAKQVTTQGQFDPSFSPSMSVCELEGNPSAVAPGGDPSVGCVDPLNIVTYFAPGTASVGESSYQFGWDTSPGAANNVSAMDPEKFYRIIISVDGVEFGFLDVNPQRPSGQSPGEDYEDLYAFRLGENLPVKIFLSVQARCALVDDAYVIQCVAQGVIEGNGGVVTLESEQTGWAKISTVVPPGALPEGYPQVILTMERIDPVLFAQANDGEECIPGLGGLFGFDAPIFGDCVRITTDPEIDVDLDVNALIDICTDFNPADYPSIKFDEEQDRRLQIIRYDEDGFTQGLANVDATTCDPILPAPGTMGFFPVPREDGFVRTAAITANRVASFFGPEPLMAHGDIRLSGSTSGFSRFSWGLPGEMVKQLGDNVIIQQQENGSESYEVDVEVLVVDAGTAPGDLPDFPAGLAPSAVEGATVNFVGAASVAPGEVTTGADGVAAALWIVPSAAGPGVYQMDATALGLLDASVPPHSGAIDFVQESVTFTATVVGLPSSATQSPPAGTVFDGLPGETILTPLTIRVVDSRGEPVVGFPVTWTTLCSADPGLCDGFVSNDTDGDPTNDDGSHLVTDANGEATGYWTLATVPGENTLTVTVGSQSLNFLAASWTAFGGCEVTVDGNRETVAGEWDCALESGDRLEFLANISGGDTPAEVRWQTDDENIYFLVLVQQSSMDKANSLRIDFDNTLNGASADDDAIGYGASSGFYDEYLGSRCVNRSQSGCGLPDTNGVDGAGALGNDGTYTVYELSHPLAGDGVQDFNVSAGDELGFYLTLRIGNGAQGNTQVPGFRNYEVIVVR